MNIFNIAGIRTRTAEARVALATPGTALTDKQIAIRDAVNRGSWGCQDASVRRLVTAITGVDCVAQRDGPEFVQGTLIVFQDETFLVCSKDHDGDARIVTSTGADETSNGETYIERDGEWRYATDEEIDAFFAE